MKFKFAALVLLFALGFSLQAIAGGRAPLIEPARVELSSSNTDAERVKNAIVQGGAAHGWKVIGEKAGQLTLQLVVRQKHTVVINADYDAKGYKLAYVSSVNMDEYPRGKKPYIHSSYNRWISILIQGIVLN